MQRRRVLYSSQYVAGFAAALKQAREDLKAMNFRHQCAHDDLMRELDKCRAELDELWALVLMRQEADPQLTALYRERKIRSAAAAQCGLARRLN
jgi:hypothetical protein